MFSLALVGKRLASSLRSFARHKSTQLSAAFVGAGPSCYFTADSLLKLQPDSEITIYEALPVLGGLCRSGIAPDHWEMRAPALRLGELVQSDPRVKFVGNVWVADKEDQGKITLEELREHHDVVVLTNGASKERTLHTLPETEWKKVAGMETVTTGVVSSSSFIGWINCDPREDIVPFVPQNAEGRVLIVGAGNVAVDIARFLAYPAILEGTDARIDAVEALKKSNIREVMIAARRGHEHTQYTTKMVRELSKLDKVQIAVEEADVAPRNEQHERYVSEKGTRKESYRMLMKNRPLRRKIELFRFLAKEWKNRSSDPATVVRLLFQHRPHSVMANKEGVLTGMMMDRVDENGRHPSEQTFVASDMLVTSLGFDPVPLLGTCLNDRGFLECTEEGKVRIEGKGDDSRVYATGWSKLGGVGGMGMAQRSGVAVAQQILDDVAEWSGQARGGWLAVGALLEERNVNYVDNEGFLRIHASEQSRGQRWTSVDDMLHVATQ